MTNNKTPTDKALEAFGEYAGMDAGELPEGVWQELQVRLCRWQRHNFETADLRDNIFGAVEELGELAHAVLKNRQKIRGISESELKQKAGDAIADCTVFLMQVATHLRIDFETVVIQTAEEHLGS